MRATQAGSHEKTTTRSRATRRSSAAPAGQSLQWWMVSTAIAASKLRVVEGQRLGAGLHRGRGAGRALGDA